MSAKATRTKPCETCGTSIPIGGRPPQKRATTRFCSHSCAGAARKNRRSCLTCGQEVKPPRKFCSRICWQGSHDHTHNKVKYICARCGKDFWRWPSQRQRRAMSGKVYCSSECRAAGRVYAVGPGHPQWKGGLANWRWVRQDGYVEVGRKLEHRLVMEQMMGRVLESHETVHHINGDRADNRPENLQLRTGRHGKGIIHHCLDCGSTNISSERIKE